MQQYCIDDTLGQCIIWEQTRAMTPDGCWLRYEYDAANWLRLIRTDAGAPVEHVGYGSTNARMMVLDYLVFK